MTTQTPAPSPDQLRVRFDDDFQTITTDVARVWFQVGDDPKSAISIAVILRSVGDNNQLQHGLHKRASQVIREALEREFAPPGPIVIAYTQEKGAAHE